MFYTYTYQRAPEPFYYQGNKSALDNFLRRNPDKVVINGSNGTYLIGGESSGQILEFENEDSPEPRRVVSPNKTKMRMYFGKQRIGENDFKNLVVALNNHAITFDDLLADF